MNASTDSNSSYRRLTVSELRDLSTGSVIFFVWSSDPDTDFDAVIVAGLTVNCERAFLDEDGHIYNVTLQEHVSNPTGITSYCVIRS